MPITLITLEASTEELVLLLIVLNSFADIMSSSITIVYEFLVPIKEVRIELSPSLIVAVKTPEVNALRVFA